MLPRFNRWDIEFAEFNDPLEILCGPSLLGQALLVEWWELEDTDYHRQPWKDALTLQDSLECEERTVLLQG